MHQGIGTVLGLEKSIADNSFGSNLDIMNLELATILFSSCIIKRYEQKVKLVLSLKGQANVISRKHLKGTYVTLWLKCYCQALLGTKVIQERTEEELLSHCKWFKIQG